MGAIIMCVVSVLVSNSAVVEGRHVRSCIFACVVLHTHTYVYMHAHVFVRSHVFMLVSPQTCKACVPIDARIV